MTQITDIIPRDDGETRTLLLSSPGGSYSFEIRRNAREDYTFRLYHYPPSGGAAEPFLTFFSIRHVPDLFELIQSIVGPAMELPHRIVMDQHERSGSAA